MKDTASSTVCVNSNMSAPHVEEHMQQLDAPSPRSPDHGSRLLKGRTPVNVDAMRQWLDLYPNRDDAETLRNGFLYGFCIPFVYSDSPFFLENLKSARGHTEVLRQKMQTKVNLGRMEGPLKELPFYNLRISPLGVIPKKEVDKFRLIHHLSFPKGSSVNDGITKECASVLYVSFDRAVFLLRSAGKGTWLAKWDIESAFRLLPIHPDCYHLLGCMVDGNFYYNTCLPMGCSISCHFFEMFSTFLEWVVRFETGSRAIIHYLDDFLFVAPGDSTKNAYFC